MYRRLAQIPPTRNLAVEDQRTTAAQNTSSTTTNRQSSWIHPSRDRHDEFVLIENKTGFHFRTVGNNSSQPREWNSRANEDNQTSRVNSKDNWRDRR